MPETAPAPSNSFITLQDIKDTTEIFELIQMADQALGNQGYTEHGPRHAKKVSKMAQSLLEHLDYDHKLCELAAIAGYAHDVGNLLARKGHAQSGALLMRELLERAKMPLNDRMLVCGAIANHDEYEGEPHDVISAAVILADKADIHHSRVREDADPENDIHDRVNLAVQRSTLDVSADRKIISLEVIMDTKVTSIMDFFKIFLLRMDFSQAAADVLGCDFHLVVNGLNLNYREEPLKTGFRRA